MYMNVRDVLVYGEVHPTLGEVPIVNVVASEEISEKDLRYYCKHKLADYKIPAQFRFVDNLEKTYNGKLKR